MKYGFLIFALFSAPLLFGQLDSNTITVTASRSLSVAPDQVVFSVTVAAGTSTTLDDVLAALAGSGITAANFSGVQTNNFGIVTGNPGAAMPVQWTFVLPVAFSKMKQTVASLTALQQSITQNNGNLALSFNVQGTQVSQQLEQMQVCPLADLLSDAQGQAQKLANVAGLSVGSILAISSATNNTANGGSAVGSLGVLVSTYQFPQTCSMTVKFTLGH